MQKFWLFISDLFFFLFKNIPSIFPFFVKQEKKIEIKAIRSTQNEPYLMQMSTSKNKNYPNFNIDWKIENLKRR